MRRSPTRLGGEGLSDEFSALLSPMSYSCRLRATSSGGALTCPRPFSSLLTLTLGTLLGEEGKGEGARGGKACEEK